MSASEVQNSKMDESQNKVPKWLKAELFEKVLRNNLKSFRKIKTFKANPALTAGENYATIMLRVEMDVEFSDKKNKNVSFMLKIGHENEMYKSIMEKHNIFDVERGMYNIIVPEMEQLYRDAGMDVKFGAKCYELPTENWNVLLEDLGAYGFKNVNRLEGLDIEHTKCVLKKMALWHAASAKRVETKGHYPDAYTHGFFTESNYEVMREMVKTLSVPFMQCAKLFDGNEDYIDNLEINQNNIAEQMQKLCATNDPNEFNVLNHGDCWSNNIMFQYDDNGKIKETYFVDYQIPKYGTPAQDLFYFILSSTNLDIKIKKFDYLIRFYHKHLIEALKLLKYPKKFPTLTDLHIALSKYGTWGISTVTGVMAAVLLDPNDNATFETFLGDSKEGYDMKMLMFSNARYRKHAEQILPWLHNRGALEIV